MQFPSWGRLVKLYEKKIAHLLAQYGNQASELLLHNPQFKAAAEQVAAQMAAEVAKVNATSWRQAAFKKTAARAIYESLRAEALNKSIHWQLYNVARRNADLISSLPLRIARQVTDKAAELRLQGARAEEIEAYIRKLRPHIGKVQARLIARTEISKAETDLTRARAENLGLAWYQWETSNDSRVRPSHKIMQGVLVNWDDPPAPEKLIGEHSTLSKYHAGSCPNCRCVALPVADLREIHFPAKVYAHGQLVRVTKAAFIKLAQLPLAA